MTDLMNVTPKDIYEKLKSDADQAYKIYQFNLNAVSYQDYVNKETLCADFAYKHESEIFYDE